MSEKVANGVLSGVVKVSGFFTSSLVNSKAGKKLFGLLPGEVALASLDGFGMIFPQIPNPSIIFTLDDLPRILQTLQGFRVYVSYL